jgi:hypothetical protein
MTQETFDYDEWKEQGEAALVALKKEEAEAKKVLVDVQGRIAKLEMILNGRPAGKTGSPKIRVKGVIEKILQECSEQQISFDQIYELVVKEKPGASLDSVKACISRLARKEERYRIGRTGDGKSRVFIEGNSKPAYEQKNAEV